MNPRAAIWSVLLVGACGVSPSVNLPGASDAGVDAGPPVCATPPGYVGAPNLLQVRYVKGTVLVFEDGGLTPLSHASTQICGPYACVAGASTGQNGVVVYSLDIELDTPALKIGDGFSVAWVDAILPASSNEMVLHSVRLPAEGSALIPGHDAVSGGVTLQLAANASVRISHSSTPLPEQQLFRAAPIPVELLSPTPSISPGLELAFGLGPSETQLCPSARLSVPNLLNWPVGTEVEFLLHGIFSRQDWAPYGGWAVVSGGRVTSGSSISTDKAGGIPVISMVGVRRKSR